jgi:hypothetical protein
MSYNVGLNNSSIPLYFLLVLSSDSKTGATGKVPTVTILKSGGGSYAAPAGAIVEDGNGMYHVAPNAADADTLGPINLHAIAIGTDPVDERYSVVTSLTPPTGVISTSSGPEPFSALDIITRAYRLLSVIDAIDSPEPEMAIEGLAVLNEIIEDLGLQPATMGAVGRSVYPLTAGVSGYTIGVGGSFNTTRPLKIESFSIVPNRNATPYFEIPMGLPLKPSEWARVSIKTLTGTFPTEIYYDYGSVNGLARIEVWPVPLLSTVDLVLYVKVSTSAFADLTTLYTFPPGFKKFFRYRLARELAPNHRIPISDLADVIRIGDETLAHIEMAADRPVELVNDAAFLNSHRRRGNIQTGEA